jgi:HTH-type transcriptional regulator/antitoxin HipB
MKQRQEPANQSISRVRTAAELGARVRAARHDSGVDQATAAGLAGVGTRFLGDVERGKESVRLGLVLAVLERLGLEVWIAPRGWKPPTR